MLIVRIIVTCVKVTADALEAQLLLVFVIIEVSGDTVVGDSGREEVDVALLALFVVYDCLSVVELALSCPVDLLHILGHV